MQTLVILGLFSTLEAARAGVEALGGLGIQRERIRSELHAGGEGGYLVSAEVDSETQFEVATNLLLQNGARHIGRQSTSWHAAKTDTASKPIDVMSEGYAAFKSTRGVRIPVVEERLKIEKRLVQRGCVQVFQSIEEIPFAERVALHVNRVLVERREPNSCAEPKPAQIKTTYELREYAEEPIVMRNPCVIEEVVIGSEVIERKVEIHDVIRKAHVEIKRLGESQSLAGEI